MSPLPNPSGPPCPICTLPSLELLLPPHSTSSTVTLNISDFDFEVLTTLVPKCDLCKLLVELRDHWASENAGKKLPLSRDGFSFTNMCENGRWWPPFGPSRRMCGFATEFGEFCLFSQSSSWSIYGSIGKEVGGVETRKEEQVYILLY